MTTTMKKTLLISLVIFLLIVGGVAVVYMVRKPTTPTTLKPTPTPIAIASAVPAPVFVVEAPKDRCVTAFTVPCIGSPSPSPSISPSPSPSFASIAPSPSPSVASNAPSPSPVVSASLECVVKRMYSDDSRNRAGFYYLEQTITNANSLTNGQTIVYNVVARNTGGSTVPETTITDKLSSNLTYVDGDGDCTYDGVSRVVTCAIGSLAANSEAQRSFRASVTVAGGTTSVANTAEITSTNGQRDSCSVTIDATGTVVEQPSEAPQALPVAGVFEVTVGTIGVGLLLLILGGLGLLLI